jgi:tetratricopeptide (TPR) repeat protein
VRTVEQLAALMTLDRASLAALPGARSPGPAMPASAWDRPEPPTALLAQPTSDPANVFAGGDALEATRALAGTRRAWLNLLAATRDADPQAAFREAARVRALPGGAEVLTPLLRPHLERARAAMAEGARGGLGARAWNDAEASIATARMLLPDAPEVRCTEGDLASARGQLPRAEDAYVACAKAEPDALPGWEGLARVRRALGNPTGTEEALRSALVAQPGLWTTSHNLGVFLLEAQRWDEAEPLLTQAAALAGRADTAAPAPTLALARLHLATDRPALALAEAERALQLEPGRPDGLAYRGAARLELGQLPMAETDFRAALDADPRSTMARSGLGQVHAARGEYDLAASAFRAVVDQDPRNEAARENLRRLGPLLQERRAPAGRDARDLDRTVSPSPPR